MESGQFPVIECPFLCGMKLSDQPEKSVVRRLLFHSTPVGLVTCDMEWVVIVVEM